MADLKPDSHHSPSEIVSDKDVKLPNIFKRAKEEMDAALHKNNKHHNETHGSRNDIDENTPLTDVKAPNVFERAKEEMEAIVEAIRHKKDSHEDDHKNGDKKKKIDSKEENKTENGEKKPNLFDKAKEEIDSIFHTKTSQHHHHKETHGTSNDIDEDTPLNEVKGPNVFERAKEEMEAIADAIPPKKEKDDSVCSSPEKEKAGFGCSIGKALEKFCSPGGSSKKD